MTIFGARGDGPAAVLVIIGGWLNPIPYLARGLGVNAFVFAGPPLQRALAGIGGLSAVALTVGLIGSTAAILR